MVGLGILEHLEGGADELLGEVHGGSFHELQAVLIHDDTHSSLLKHSESRAHVRHKRTHLIKLNLLLFLKRTEGSLPVVFILASDNSKLVLEAGAASSLHVYSQVLALLHDF